MWAKHTWNMPASIVGNSDNFVINYVEVIAWITDV